MALFLVCPENRRMKMATFRQRIGMAKRWLRQMVAAMAGLIKTVMSGCRQGQTGTVALIGMYKMVRLVEITRM